MIRTDGIRTVFHVFRDLVPVVTSGILSVALLSCVSFGLQTYLNVTHGTLSVGSSVFVRGQVHRLVTYPFYHRTLTQLLLDVVALVFLCGTLEKGVGTVRFLFLFLLLSTLTGFFYSIFDLLQTTTSTEGLLPVALACAAFTTTHTRMTRGFLCGVTFPTMALPWVLVLVTTVLLPLTVLSCNVVAALTGWMHGRGWFFFLDISEAQAGVVEKTAPFRLLRSISAGIFVPASTEERRKTLLPQVNPPPGSYPVQAYAPLSNTGGTTAHMDEGWVNSTGGATCPTSLPGPHAHGSVENVGQSCSHQHLTHGHGHL